MAVTLTTSYQLIASKSTSTYSTLRLYGKYNSQSVSGNTSSITLQARLYGNGGSGSFSSGSIKLSTTENNSTSSLGSTSYSKSSETTLKTWTTSVSHNTDGTYSNKSVSAVLTSSSSPNGTASGTINLPTIPRASQPTASPNPVDVGASTLIKFNQASNTFTHDISLTFGTINWNIGTGYTNQVILQIPTTFYNEFTSTERQKNATFTCVTKSGSTTIGTKTLTIGIRIPDSSSPTYSNVSKAETDADVISAIGSSMSEAILGLSKPRYQMTLASQNGATLSTATIKCGDLSNTIALSGTSYSLDYTFVNAMTSNVVQIIITDSRGLQTTYADTYSNYQTYQKPTITSQSVARTDVGTGRVTFDFEGTMQPDHIDGVQGNGITASYRYKENSESATWSSSSNVNVSYNTGRTEWYINQDVGTWAVYNKSWIVELTIADSCTPNNPLVRTYTINKAVPSMSLGENDLQVNGDLYVADEDGQNARNVLEDIGDLSQLTTTNKDSLVDAINDGLSGLIYTENVTLATNMTIAGGSSPATQTKTLSPRSGYKPAMVTLHNVYNGAITFWYLNLDSNNNTISWRVRNNTTSQATGITIMVKVLYVKTSSFLGQF